MARLLFNLAKIIKRVFKLNDKYLEGQNYSLYEYKKAIAFDKKFHDISYQDKVVVDIGCGFGGSLLHYQDQGASMCYGIEFEKSRANTSIKFLRAQRANTKQILVINADARELPFKNNSIHVITSDAAFEHIIDLEKVIDEMYRVLQRGGKAYFSCGGTWFTYNGGHLWNYIPIPWVHLVVPKSIIISTLRLYYTINNVNFPKKRIDNIIDLYLTLGRLSVYSLNKILRRSRFLKFKVFQYSNRKWKNFIKDIIFINDLFAGSVCCVLEK
ncbi:MAG: class I SAM-dependent methyltransferase [Candidatus Hodarchaeota archaeon]